MFSLQIDNRLRRALDSHFDLKKYNCKIAKYIFFLHSPFVVPNSSKSSHSAVTHSTHPVFAVTNFDITQFVIAKLQLHASSVEKYKNKSKISIIVCSVANQF